MSTEGRPPGRAGRPAQVSRDAIVTAAVELIDEEGLAALTMRALGARLDVAAMSLYRHLPNRDAVLAAVVDRLFAIAMADLDPGPSWTVAMTRFAETYRAMLLTHPNAVPLLATHPVDVDAALPLFSGALARFLAAGLDQEQAMTVVQSVAVYVLGHVLAQAGTPPGSTSTGAPAPAPTAYYDRWFDAGLRALVTGFAAVPPPAGPTPPG